jgi:hypothetical protein
MFNNGDFIMLMNQFTSQAGYTGEGMPVQNAPASDKSVSQPAYTSVNPYAPVVATGGSVNASYTANYGAGNVIFAPNTFADAPIQNYVLYLASSFWASQSSNYNPITFQYTATRAPLDGVITTPDVSNLRCSITTGKAGETYFLEQPSLGSLFSLLGNVRNGQFLGSLNNATFISSSPQAVLAPVVGSLTAMINKPCLGGNNMTDATDQNAGCQSIVGKLQASVEGQVVLPNAGSAVINNACLEIVGTVNLIDGPLVITQSCTGGNAINLTSQLYLMDRFVPSALYSMLKALNASGSNMTSFVATYVCAKA